MPQAQRAFVKWSETGWRSSPGIGGAQTVQGLVVHVKVCVLYPKKMGSHDRVLNRGWYNWIGLAARWRVAKRKVGWILSLAPFCLQGSGAPISSVAPIAMFTKHSGHKGHGDKPPNDMSQVPQVPAQMADPTPAGWWQPVQGEVVSGS